MYKLITNDFKVNDQVEVISNDILKNKKGHVYNIKGVFITVKFNNNLLSTFFENELLKVS